MHWIAAVTCAGLVGGCGTSASDGVPPGAEAEAPAQDADAARTESARTVSPEANAHQQAVVARIMAGVGNSAVRTIRFAPVPPDFEKPSEDAVWLLITVNVSDDIASSVKAYWQGLLVAGAFRDLSHAEGLPPVVGKTILLRFPDGRLEDEGSSVIDQPFEHSIRESTPDGIESLVATGVRESGLKAHNVVFSKPLQLAAEIYAVTADPEDFARNRSENVTTLLAGGRLIDHVNPLVEGTYLEVTDQSGDIVTVSAYSVRTGEGVGWTRPELQQGVGFGTVSGLSVPDDG